MPVLTGCQQSLDWTTGLDYRTGLPDWTTGLDYWTGLPDWTTGLISLTKKFILVGLKIFLSLNRVLEVLPKPPPPPPQIQAARESYKPLILLCWWICFSRGAHQTMLLHFQILLKGGNCHSMHLAYPIQCSANAQPMSSLCCQCPAYAQPMPSLCSANVQPMLSQCPAYAQPMSSLISMLSQCPAYAQPMSSLCSANVQPNKYAQPMLSNVQPMPRLCSIV